MGAQAIAQFVTLVIRLAEIPLLVTIWGSDLYGQWLVLAAIPSYLAFSDLGFISSINRFLVVPVTQGDFTLATKVFQTSSLLALLLSVGFSLVFVAIFLFTPVAETFHVTAVGTAAVVEVALFLCGKIVVSMQGQALFGVYMAIHRYPLGLILLSLCQLLEFGAMAVAVFIGEGFVGAALAMLLGQSVGVLVMLVGISRYASWLTLGFRAADFTLLKRFWSPALASLTFPAGDAIGFQGTRLIVAYLLGPTALVLFVAHRQIARLSTQVATGARIFEAEIAYAFAADNHDFLGRINRRLFQTMLWASLAVTATLMVGAPVIFPTWTGHKIQFDLAIFLVLLAASLLECLWRVVIHPLLMTNQHSNVSAWIFAIRCASVAVAYVAGLAWGMLGIVGVIAAFEAVIFIVAIRAHLDIFGDNLRQILSIVGKPPLELILRALREIRT